MFKGTSADSLCGPLPVAGVVTAEWSFILRNVGMFNVPLQQWSLCLHGTTGNRSSPAPMAEGPTFDTCLAGTGAATVDICLVAILFRV
jgi:hypothetical protein